MVLSTHILVALAILGIAIAQTLATDYVVGDGDGWTFGGDYQAWASGKKFLVIDKFIFKYPTGKHNVIEVNNDSFQACTAPAGAVIRATGNDVIELKTLGTNMYICGIGKHCAVGNMKLSINVSASN